MKIGSPFLKEY